MNFNNLKQGNYVRYIGQLQKYHGQIGQISSIDSINNEETYELLIKSYPNDSINKIRAYQNDVGEIILNDDFLKKQGFAFNGQTRQFELGSIVIFKPIYIKNNIGNFGRIEQCYDDKGFRVINKFISDYSNEEEVLSNSYSINTVNSYQNYFEIIHNKVIEINL